jgi:hypothetical protein
MRSNHPAHAASAVGGINVELDGHIGIVKDVKLQLLAQRDPLKAFASNDERDRARGAFQRPEFASKARSMSEMAGCPRFASVLWTLTWLSNIANPVLFGELLIFRVCTQPIRKASNDLHPRELRQYAIARFPYPDVTGSHSRFEADSGDFSRSNPNSKKDVA